MLVGVYPVNFENSDNNFYSERIRYKNGSWGPTDVEWCKSWLRIILADPVEELKIYQMDLSKVLIINEMAFYCDGDRKKIHSTLFKDYPKLERADATVSLNGM